MYLSDNPLIKRLTFISFFRYDLPPTLVEAYFDPNKNKMGMYFVVMVFPISNYIH